MLTTDIKLKTTRLMTYEGITWFPLSSDQFYKNDTNYNITNIDYSTS